MLKEVVLQKPHKNIVPRSQDEWKHIHTSKQTQDVWFCMKLWLAFEPTKVFGKECLCACERDVMWHRDVFRRLEWDVSAQLKETVCTFTFTGGTGFDCLESEYWFKLLKKISALDFVLAPENYFPQRVEIPSQPFKLNLRSKDETINRSKQCRHRGIDCT